MQSTAQAAHDSRTRDDTTYDVAVVGLGPVGTIAALLLAREGLRVVALDKTTDPYDKPRAIGIDHESLRTLQKICDSDRLAALLGPYRKSEYWSRSGEVLRRIIPQPEPFALGWPASSTFIQPELEGVLRAELIASEVETCLGWNCENVSQDDCAATLRLEHADTAEEKTLTAQYVLACDGA